MKIPPQLAERPNWIVWRSIIRNGKATKLPFDALTGRLASTSDPADWSTLEQAQAAMLIRKYTGLGFVFAKGEGLFGVDLDCCYGTLYDLEPWADMILRAFATYSEVSPSRYGVKLFGLADFQERGCVAQMGDFPKWGKRPAVEVYGWGRFFAFTGEKLDNFPDHLVDCTRPLAHLVKTILMGRPQRPSPPPTVLVNSDFDKVKRARAYLRKVPPRSDSIAGCNNRTFRACCVLLHEIGLPFDEALSLLNEWNTRSETPWTLTELSRKLGDAQKKGK